MAAAGVVKMGIDLALSGVGDVVRDIRTTAKQFDFLAGSARDANDAVSDLRAQLTSGASAGAFGAVASQFRAIGLAAGQIPDVAHEFRERLFHDAFTIGTFGRSVRPARLGGPPDETATLREAIRLLRETKNAEERLFRARRLGLEVLLPLADLSEKSFRAVEREGAARGALVDEDLRRLRAEKEGGQGRLRDIAEEHRLVIERNLTRGMNRIRDYLLLPLAEFFRQGGPIIPNRRARDARAGRDPIAEIRERANKDAERSEGAINPLDRSARSLERVADALEVMQREYYGLGISARTSRAMPSGYRWGQGNALQHALEANGFQMGAFSIGTGGL